MENAFLAVVRAMYCVMKICKWPVPTEERGWDAKARTTRVNGYLCA